MNSPERFDRSQLQWHWQHFELFSVKQWHEVLHLRARIFVAEQQCPYVDPDSKDCLSWHLQGWLDGTTVATLRAVPPGVSYTESSMGRVAVDQSLRGTRLGWEIMQLGIAFSHRMWGTGIRISAQSHLEQFYHSLGFDSVGKAYLEDDIPHIEMLLPAAERSTAA